MAPRETSCMRKLLGSSLAFLFLAPLVAAESPSLAGSATTSRIQEFVDGLLGIAEVQAAFQPGDLVVVAVGTDSWHGNVDGTSLPLTAGGASGATHTLRVDPAAMMSIVNSYDMGNTAKLAVKKQYMTAESERAAVKTAIGAVARTPLDDRLPTYDPKQGDSVTFQGCTGTLGAKTEGRFVVQLCDDNYTVNEIGGITSKLARPHFMAAPAVTSETLSEDAGESYGADDVAASACLAKVGGPPPLTFPPTQESADAFRAAYRIWLTAYVECIYSVVAAE